MYTNKLLKKYSYIRHHHGKEAAQYFAAHPVCEKCGEARLACLSVHHVNGRRQKVFKTLCFNDHMLHHANDATYTASMGEAELDDKELELTERANNDAKIAGLVDSGMTIVAVGKLLGIPRSTVSYARLRHLNKPRVGAL